MTLKTRLLTLLAGATCTALSLVAAPSAQEIDAKVAELLAKMTQEEKIGQLIQYSSPSLSTGPEGRANIEREVRAGRCGSVFNYIGVDQVRPLQENAVKHSRLGIPLIFGYDVIHGFRTILPVNLGQAASWDLEAIEKAERIAAKEASSAGINWTFAPMVDIARDPRWGRIAEGSGEDPFLGSAIARARVHGFQGDDLSKPDTVIACAKHFAAYGASQAGRDYWTTEVPEITLRDVYLPPFKAALDAGVETFMAAFNDLNGVPCSANSFLLTQVLRKEWGFQGFVVSDWMSSLELIEHGIVADKREAAKISFGAGVDMDMMGGIFGKHIDELIKSGLIPQARLDSAVAAILRSKFKLGLFEDPYRYCDADREKNTLLAQQHLEFARDFARKCCVLLKNENQLLPLPGKARIALVGPLADSRRDLLGCWAGQGRENETVSIRSALEEAYPDSIQYALGCTIQGDDKTGFDAALAAASKSDLIIAVVGERWNMSGEGYCRTNLDLPGNQEALIEALAKTGKPLVLVVIAGRPLTLGRALAHADAVLFAWNPGTMGGPAVSDVLTGAYNPSGKLPVTFPRSVGQIPLFYASKHSGRPQDDSKPRQQFRTNYIDLPNTPEYPFGYGLSYTSFHYGKTELSSPVLDMKGSLTITTTLSNTGGRDGTEIVQLYVRDLVGSVTRPVRELKGFAKVTLKKGESRQVSFTLKAQDLAFHHADMSFAPEAGRFEVYVGTDSTAPKVAEFELR